MSLAKKERQGSMYKWRRRRGCINLVAVEKVGCWINFRIGRLIQEWETQSSIVGGFR